MTNQRESKRVSILALPESTGTPIHGIYETLKLLDAVATGPEGGTTKLFEVHRSFRDVNTTDIVIAASMLFENREWVTGRHPETTEWLRRMHRSGADLGSACAGALLLAETGLLDGQETTTHWAFAPTFRRNFPKVRLRIDELIVVAGSKGEFVMSGAASSWQELILYLMSRHASPTSTQEIGRFLLYRWDSTSQEPFVPFAPASDHGDATIRRLQLRLHADEGNDISVERMAGECGLPWSTFNRRFKRATGYSPLRYVQNLRVEQARRLLERTDESVERISWNVGYREPAAFRRVFKRITALSPAEYRR